MDAKLQKKIEELTVSVEQRNARYHRAVVLTGIVYGILVVFVFGYTSYLYQRITALSTPENLSQFVVNSVRAQFPTLREGAREKMPQLAAAIAEEVVSGGISMIPNAGTYARASVDEQVDFVLNDFDKKDMPVIEAALDDAISQVLAKDGAKDPDSLANDISFNAAAKITDELDKIVNQDFYSSLDRLKINLNDLRNKAPEALTSRDAAERECIFCWLRLNEIAETDESDPTFFSLISQVSGSVAKTLQKEEQSEGQE